MAALSATHDLTKTIVPAKLYLRWTPTAGSVVEIPILSAKMSRETTDVTFDKPGSDGILRPGRVAETKIVEKVTCELDEFIQANLDLAIGAARVKTGTAQIFVADNDDAATKLAASTNAFAAYLKLKSGMDFARAAGSKWEIELTAFEAVVWTADATAPV